MDVENLQIPLTFLANVLGFFTKSVEQNQLDLFDKISITMEVYDGTPFCYWEVCIAFIQSRVTRPDLINKLFYRYLQLKKFSSYDLISSSDSKYFLTL